MLIEGAVLCCAAAALLRDGELLIPDLLVCALRQALVRVSYLIGALCTRPSELTMYTRIFTPLARTNAYERTCAFPGG